MGFTNEELQKINKKSEGIKRSRLFMNSIISMKNVGITLGTSNHKNIRAYFTKEEGEVLIEEIRNILLVAISKRIEHKIETFNEYLKAKE